MIVKNAVLTLLAAAVLLQGCGTIVHGGDQDLAITTVPSGATALVGTQECITPCTMRISRASDRINFRKGKLKREYYFDKSFNLGATVCGNILWLVPGLIVDFIVGGAYTIKPVNVRLTDLPAEE